MAVAARLRPDGARMGLPVHVHQASDVQVRVALRRAELRVTEQFLDRAQIGARPQQMRSKGMPQGVRADPLRNARRSRRLPDDAIDAAGGEAAASLI